MGNAGGLDNGYAYWAILGDMYWALVDGMR